MQQWDRDTSGRLNRISTQLDLASEVRVQTDTMDPIPEEQQSQPGTPMNPNAYRTMRDHIHPPRVSAPSCIIDELKSHLFFVHFSVCFSFKNE